MYRPLTISCNFCSKSQSATFRGRLIQGVGAYICLDCAELAGKQALEMQTELISKELAQFTYTELRAGALSDQPGMAKAIAQQIAKLVNPFRTA